MSAMKKRTTRSTLHSGANGFVAWVHRAPGFFVPAWPSACRTADAPEVERAAETAPGIASAAPASGGKHQKEVTRQAQMKIQQRLLLNQQCEQIQEYKTLDCLHAWWLPVTTHELV